MSTDEWDDDKYWRPKGATEPAPARLEPAKSGRMGSRRIGSLHEVTVGVSVWSRVTGPVEDVRMRGENEPVGGIVLEIVDLGGVADEETGEIRTERAFRTYDPWCPTSWARNVLPERCVNPHACEYTPPSVLANLARYFADQAGRCKGPVTPSEARLVADARRITQALLGATP